MPITFRQLQVFVAAARDGNFRKTADRLGISQPAVSAQIRAIELELGYALFDRRRGASSMLSIEGQAFLTRACELVEEQCRLMAERQARRRSQPAAVRVSVGPILLETRLKPMLPDLYDRCPEIEIDFVPFDPSGDAGQAVRTGSIDVLLYTGGYPDHIRVKTEVVSPVTSAIYAAPELAQSLSGRLEALCAAPFVMPPPEYHLSQWFEAQLASKGLHLQNVVARAPSMEVALQMVVAGKGLALLFDEHAAAPVANGEVQAIGGHAFSAYRVLMMGKRALRPEYAPVLKFLRRVAAPRERASDFTHTFNAHSAVDARVGEREA